MSFLPQDADIYLWPLKLCISGQDDRR